jgi:hypothetical protein
MPRPLLHLALLACAALFHCPPSHSHSFPGHPRSMKLWQFSLYTPCLLITCHIPWWLEHPTSHTMASQFLKCLKCHPPFHSATPASKATPRTLLSPKRIPPPNHRSLLLSRPPSYTTQSLLPQHLFSLLATSGPLIPLPLSCHHPTLYYVPSSAT